MKFAPAWSVLVSASSSNFTGDGVLQQLGIQGLPARGPINNLPIFSVTGFASDNINLLNPVNDGHAQLADNLSWVHGRHAMKFGLEHVNFFVNRYMPNTSGIQVFGSFAFTGKFTGNAYADFLLGLPATVTRLEPFPAQYNRFHDWSGYAQDDFKITRKLTLMYGLRWEYNGPAYTLNDNVYSFDLATGKIVVPNQAAQKLFSPYFPTTFPVEFADQIGTGRSLRKADKNNFAPRFGFSYQLDNAGKTVLRGGWGIYYSHYSGNIPGDLSRGPYAATTVFTNNIVNGAAQVTLANPFSVPGTPGTVALTAVTPNLKNSYAQQYTPYAGARTHARYRPARELHRLQGDPACLPPRCQPAGGIDRGLQQRAPPVSSIQQHQLRRQRRQYAVQRPADGRAEALQQGPDVHVHVDVGQGNQRYRRYRRFRTQQHDREHLQPPARSRQCLLRAAPPVDESGALRTALRQRTIAVGLADQYASQREHRELVHAA